ncbi:MAG TPA: Spy/CpxP family protein refolding chaperone [Gemmatimonadaceae bacterium]|nr:Spy/CpxP family protein refolding chaperone [Gemmatimonadaceae bacterium]
MSRIVKVFMVLALIGPFAAGAQGRSLRQGRRMGMPPDSTGPGRAQLEERVRQRFAQRLKTQLGLTDDQMAKVRDINLRYAERRRTLLDQERDVRMSLREAVVAADSTRQGDVAKLLDRMMTSQRQRIDLLEQEQKDLASVLTPLQRATYMGMEEQLRQAVEGMRGGRGGRMGAPGGPPPDGANGQGVPNGPRARRGPPGAPPGPPAGAPPSVSPDAPSPVQERRP